MTRLRRIHGEDGFTVIELLTAMTVFSIVLAIFSMVLSSSLRHSGEIEESGTLQAEARGAITSLSQDLRQMYDGDDDILTTPLESISSTQITFLSPDRAQPFHLRRISYRLVSGRLERATLTSTDTDGSPWVIPGTLTYRKLVGSVVTATPFIFKNAAGATLPATNTLANRSLVKTIDFTLTVATKTSTNRQYTYQTSATVRGES